VTVEDDSILFFSNRNDTSTQYNKIFLMNADGENVKELQLSSSGEIQIGIDTSSDGRRLLYTDKNDNAWISNSDGTGPMKITSGKQVNQMSLSPDGTKIVYTSFEGNNENTDIFIMDVDGSNIKNLTKNSYYDGSPDWSPDGTKILYVSTEFSNPYIPKICVMNPDGSNRYQIAKGTGIELEPQWSPDGSKITYQSGDIQAGVYAIWVMKANGTDKLKLTSTNVNSEVPVWSPQSDTIVFCSTKADGNYEIYAVGSDGGDLVQLTDNTARDIAPVWLMPKKGVAVDVSTLGITEDFKQSAVTREVSNIVKSAVVCIEASTTDGKGDGTGFIIKPSGVTITANHMIGGANVLTASLTEEWEFAATMLARDNIYNCHRKGTGW
jgi:TolB protein